MCVCVVCGVCVCVVCVVCVCVCGVCVCVCVCVGCVCIYIYTIKSCILNCKLIVGIIVINLLNLVSE